MDVSCKLQDQAPAEAAQTWQNARPSQQVLLSALRREQIWRQPQLYNTSISSRIRNALIPGVIWGCIMQRMSFALANALEQEGGTWGNRMKYTVTRMDAVD